MESHFNITICSDQDYEKLIAEVYYDGNFIAVVHQENGELEVEASLEVLKHLQVKTEELENVISMAKRRLIEDA